MTRDLRLFAALGPGDIVGAGRNRLTGNAINETSIAFSEQLFAYCRHHQIPTLAISSNSRVASLDDGPVLTENRPKPLRGRAGLLFHVSQVLYGTYLAARALQFGANFAIIDSGTTHYFVLVLFRLVGISVAVNLHNVLWPCGHPPTGVGALIRRMNKLYFRFAAVGAIGVSPECERQVLSEAGGAIPFFQYRCQYNSKGFISAKPYNAGTFRIVFAGRVEENKGVLDIVEIAKILRGATAKKIVFEVCGEGPALSKLQAAIERDNLNELVIAHGRLERQALLTIYANSHAAIVPTRSDFAEGMPQVCAEAVLSNLPVITSQVTNAFDVIDGAVVRAETNDVSSYARAVLLLIEKPELYGQIQATCPLVSRQFFDRDQSYPSALDRLLAVTMPPQSGNCDYDKIFDELIKI
ncbi:glycosyltransferase [Bradyrhizobium sp. GCM10023182]|uniref:Glycosyltransferase n=1 Tax=Bradyrhizobium zhengyangense TaxID=2911009 RepID=A0ABS9M216_9BRAD|nr:glycosyltransferase [Bradyrhizobium zhengyangense]MCG2673303.1 glycosyltransferase [Bradyrhizobium zhengyangense]